MIPVRYILKRIKVFFVYRVLHVNDTPHRIALGVAIGMFIAWTPTLGFQMILTILLAALFRANKLVGVPFVWISNPGTLWLYIPNFFVGKWILGRNCPMPHFFAAMSVTGSWWGEVWVNRIIAWWEATWNVFAPLWLGSIVVGLFLGLATYAAVRHVVVTYRTRRHLKHPNRKKLPL